MKKITLALVGAGERGQNSYAPYAKLHGYAIEFVAVAEPDPIRRERFRETYGLPAENCFDSAEDFFSRPRMADAVLICTQDRQHYKQAVAAIRLGYKILLEKPISPSARECLELQRLAEEHGTEIMVCHVLRYTKFYKKVRELLRSGVIGRVMSVTHTENVGYWHYAHSYVRGNWRNTAEASPMILAKCSHDMDILSWLLDSRCESVSSFGSLQYFTSENAPEGAPERCLDGCPHSGSCPFYAPAVYLTESEAWPASSLGGDTSYAAREKALREGPYGRCVYRCDNDVVDHQVASLSYENGVTVAFTMAAFSNACDRTMKFMGTKGELRASMDNNVVEVTQYGQGVMTGPTAVHTIVPASSHHSGGDEGIMEEFTAILRGDRENTNTISQSVHSHIIALAAEESRLTGRTVSIRDFEERTIKG